jgi:hypothetical protein
MTERLNKVLGTDSQAGSARGIAEGTAVRVDLRRCTYLDSTFRGILLFLRRSLA